MNIKRQNIMNINNFAIFFFLFDYSNELFFVIQIYIISFIKHFKFIIEWIRYTNSFQQKSIQVMYFKNVLQANLIYLLNQDIPLVHSQTQNVINYSLFERKSSWIHTVYSAYLNNQFLCILSNFRVFVADPLACKLNQLLIISTNNNL